MDLTYVWSQKDLQLKNFTQVEVCKFDTLIEGIIHFFYLFLFFSFLLAQW
jgi:hypothetical protein